MATLKKVSLKDVAAEQKSLKLVSAGKLLNPLFAGIKESLVDLQSQAERHDGAEITAETSAWSKFADTMEAAVKADIAADDFAVLAMSNFDKEFSDTLTKTRRAYISTAVNGYAAMTSTYAPKYADDVTKRAEDYSNEVDGSRKVAGAELTAQRFIEGEAFVIGEGDECERISYEAMRKVISGVNGEVAKEKSAPLLRFQSLLKDYTSRIGNTIKDRKENAEKSVTGLEGRDVNEMIAWLETQIKAVPKRHTVTEGKAVISKALEHRPTADQPTETEEKDAPPARGVRKVG